MAQIDKPNLHFNTTIWTGDNTTPKTFTSWYFQTRFIMDKIRTEAYKSTI